MTFLPKTSGRSSNNTSIFGVFSRYAPDISCILFTLFSLLTISEPFLFRSIVPSKNYVLFALAILGFSQFVRGGRLTRTAQFAISFFVIALVSVGIQKATIRDVYDSFGRSSQGYALSVLLYCGLCFSAGGALPLIARAKMSKHLVVAAAVSALYMFLSNSDGPRIWWGSLVYADGTRPNHLSVDEAVTSLFFLAYATSRSQLRYGFALALLACLFASGSRASIFIAALAFVGAEVLARGGGRKWIYIALSAVTAGLVLSLNTRVVAFFIDSLFPRGVMTDESYQIREIIIVESSKYLFHQFWIGDPTIVAAQFGSMGAFVHNLLSSWQFYGFFAFMSLVATIISATYNAVKSEYRSARRRHVFGLAILLYAVVGVTTAKYFGVHSLWFALGYWSTMALPGGAVSMRGGRSFTLVRPKKR